MTDASWMEYAPLTNEDVRVRVRCKKGHTRDYGPEGPELGLAICDCGLPMVPVAAVSTHFDPSAWERDDERRMTFFTAWLNLFRRGGRTTEGAE